MAKIAKIAISASTSWRKKSPPYQAAPAATTSAAAAGRCRGSRPGIGSAASCP